VTKADPGSPFTKNQKLVLDVLEKQEGRMSAYEILDTLRPEGFKAPLQVYRALEQLMKLGFVHKLESLNAFIACQHTHCAKQDLVAFTICDTCEQVTELNDTSLSKQLSTIADRGDFSVVRSTVELHGQCGSCRSN